MLVKEYDINQMNQIARRVRRSVVEMAHYAGAGGAHLGGNLSCVEIMTSLYFGPFQFDIANPTDDARDRFLPGKAHCILTQYSVMKELGIIDEKTQYTFKDDGGTLVGHPKIPEYGLEYSSGTLGMAISVATGMALAAKRAGASHKIYVMMGDGECDEGIVWESIMTAVKYGLDNLVIIVDRNHLQLSGTVEEVMNFHDLPAMFRSFGCHVQETDGHDIANLLKAYENIKEGCPNVILAQTVKGKGLSFVENHVEWHQNVLTDRLYEQALEELGDE